MKNMEPSAKPKWPPGGSKMADGVWEVIGRSEQLLQNRFFEHSFYEKQRTNPKLQNGRQWDQKWQMGSGKWFTQVIGCPEQLSQNRFFFIKTLLL